MSKTYTGGYRLVSLTFVDLALASTVIAVAGLGDALGIKSRKRIVLTDIVVSGEKKNDLSVQVKKDGNNYVIEDVYGYDLSIDASGNLTSSEHSIVGDGGTKLYLHTIKIGATITYSGSTDDYEAELNVVSNTTDAPTYQSGSGADSAKKYLTFGNSNSNFVASMDKVCFFNTPQGSWPSQSIGVDMGNFMRRLVITSNIGSGASGTLATELISHTVTEL